MTSAQFPWRPLGALLVERELLTDRELEEALLEQQRNGRLLGQILVDRDYLSGFSLTRVLADQHGVTVRPKAAAPEIGASAETRWRPLGRLLVDKRLVDEAELNQALAEQRERRARLGEILVARGYLSGLSLARALAEQHGLDPKPMTEVEAAIAPTSPAESLYEVRVGSAILFASPNLLDAADYASELVQHDAADGVELHRTRGDVRETVWAFSAAETPGRSLVETFGFDPTRWSAG